MFSALWFDGWYSDPGAAGRNPARRSKERGVEEIRAEMAAVVFEVVAREGQSVAEGDTVVIVESMKMEIPVLAETSGTVAEIAVAVGQSIRAGDLIVRITD